MKSYLEIALGDEGFPLDPEKKNFDTGYYEHEAFDILLDLEVDLGSPDPDYPVRPCQTLDCDGNVVVVSHYGRTRRLLSQVSE